MTGEITNSGDLDILCNSYLCKMSNGNILTSDEIEAQGLTCNGRKDCLNTDLDESKEHSVCHSTDDDDAKHESTLPSGKIILSSTIL